MCDFRRVAFLLTSLWWWLGKTEHHDGFGKNAGHENWNIHTLEPSIPKSTEKFLCCFFKNLTKGLKKTNWETESLRCTELNSYRLTPTLSQSWSKNNNNNYNYSNLLPVDRLLFTGTRNRFSLCCVYTGTMGWKGFRQLSVTVRGVLQSFTLCFSATDVRSTGKEKLPNTSVQTESSSPGARYCKERRWTSPAKPLENVQIIPKIY